MESLDNPWTKAKEALEKLNSSGKSESKNILKDENKTNSQSFTNQENKQSTDNGNNYFLNWNSYNEKFSSQNPPNNQYYDQYFQFYAMYNNYLNMYGQQAFPSPVMPPPPPPTTQSQNVILNNTSNIFEKKDYLSSTPFIYQKPSSPVVTLDHKPIKFNLSKTRSQPTHTLKTNVNQKNVSVKINNENKNNNSSNTEWPQSLKNYVQKCFGSVSEIQKDEMELKLKNILTVALKDKTAFSKDWDNEPLIQLDAKDLLSPENLINHETNKLFQKKSGKKTSRFSSLSPEEKEQKDQNNFQFNQKEISRNQNKTQKCSVKKKKKFHAFTIGEGQIESSNEKLQSRAVRFNSLKIPTQDSIFSYQSQILAESEDVDWTSFHIVGSCQNLEKPYLRLTTAPDVSSVRPLEILKKSLDLVKSKWTSARDYAYVCEQMKSIRQDLTVQGIRNDFTVYVYETHARIAIEKGDHEEFNQCQTQLKALYSEGIHGNSNEFCAYRILYYIFTKSTSDISSTIGSLSRDQKKNTNILHAIRVHSALSLKNYYKFFKLFLVPQNMSSSIMNWFIERERKNALKVFIKSYRPDLQIKMISDLLAFENTDECIQFLNDLSLIISNDKLTLDIKLNISLAQNI